MTRPSLEGSLTKWTNVVKGWQYRWFVLDENAGLLSYYTSREKMKRGVRRGCVRLKGAIIGIDNEEDGNFTITTDSKTFHFQASDSERREIWVKALENTILRHAPYDHQHQVQPILVLRKHMPHHLLKTHFEGDDLSYEANMKKFDSRISQADVLLQILIDETQKLELRTNNVNDDALKMRLGRISHNYTKMVGAVKLAIVLLQILKSTVDPVTGIGLVTSLSKSKKSRRGSNNTNNNLTEQSAITPMRASSTSEPHSSSQCAVSSAQHPNKIELGSECIESRHLMPAVIESLQMVSGVNTPEAMTLIVPPDIVPETSYSSSDDDEDFFDADEELHSPTGGNPVRVNAFMAYGITNNPKSNIKDSTTSTTAVISGTSSASNSNPVSSSAGSANKSIPIVYKDGTVDYDALYEDDSGQYDLSMENHGSVITHLLSQVKIGMDLTKVVLPTFILERRSLLEMYADYFAHPDLFVNVVDKKTPRDRMVQVVKWYLSAYHAGRKSSVAKKPYNPIIGEVFQCHWNIPGCNNTKPANEGPVPWCSPDQLTFIAEQVSHHPPISAFYAEHISKKISFNAYIYTKSKFLGLSIGVHNVGFGTVSVLDYDEEYVVTFPSGYGRSILTTPWIELGGSVTITCKKTGYHADIEFHTKPFYGGKRNKITGEVYAPNEKKSFLSVNGEWNGVMEAKWADSGKTEVFCDVTTLPVTKKMVRRICEQAENESRNLWKEVTLGLRLNDIEKATTAKSRLEQKQRDEAKSRKDSSVDWQTQFFSEQNGDWFFLNPLSLRKKNTSGTKDVNR